MTNLKAFNTDGESYVTGTALPGTKRGLDTVAASHSKDWGVGSSGAASNAVLTTNVTDWASYQKASFQIIGSAFVGEIIVEGSNDNSIWYTVSTMKNAGGWADIIFVDSLYSITIEYKYYRVKISSYTSGSVLCHTHTSQAAPLHYAASQATLANVDSNTGNIANKLPSAVGQNTMSDSLSVVIAANQSRVPVSIGHTNHTYKLLTGVSVPGANKVHFDLFNASGSFKTMRILSVKAIKDGSQAVTGAVSYKLYLTFTSAVGTGGTAHNENNTTVTGVSISELDAANDALPAQVTARLNPTGGATAGAVLAVRNIFPEETNAANYEPIEFVDAALNKSIQTITCAEGTGIRIVQGSTASVGNIDFEVVFELE